jgi:uncharacterized protein (TIGR02145 family)
MKKLLFLFCIFCALKANAQNYLISFSGTGASNTVSTVKVDNIAKGTTLTITGSDVLYLTTVTGVNSVRENQSPELKIYPNPMSDYSTLEIFPPVEGDAVITILDITGKPVVQTQSFLENFRQDFRLTGIKSGFYLINVKGNGYRLSGKLLSSWKSGGTISIEKVNNSIQPVDEKTEKKDSKGIQRTFEMDYTTGERLMFTGSSGNYSTVLTDIPSSDKTITFNFIACTDGDNTNYPVVAIGSQVWMAENLKTTRYNNGDSIGTTYPARKFIVYEVTPKYQWAYGGVEANVATKGRLYTWYAVMDNRAVCPAGWHIPGDIEWKTLEMYLGMTQLQADSSGLRGTDQGTRLKGIWSKLPGCPNCYGSGTNTFGFTALSCGHRVDSGSFESGFGEVFWWSSTADSLTGAWRRTLKAESAKVERGTKISADGLSVRCLKDN